MKVKKKRLTMDELVTNAKKVLKGKELNPNGKVLFQRALKKSIKPRGSK